MSKYPVMFKKIHEDAVAPSYAAPGDAGADIRAIEDASLEPGQFALIKTGIAVQLPPAHELQVRPRSGLAYKNGVTVLNSPGTVDEGYRGEIGVILINHGTETFNVEKGMKIAQVVIKAVKQFQFIEVDELSDTIRGEGGFGSTGV